jgi:putative oxidoreductase
MLVDVGLLVLRVIVGLMVAAHGAQKLFGWWGGPGMKGFTGWLTSMGLRPASFWAIVAALGEFGGGLLFALGLFDPIGSFGIMGAMLTAIALVHWGKGIWASKGGIEHPLMILAAALAVAFTGPGSYSLDAILKIGLPETTTLRIGGFVLVILSLIAILLMRKTQPAQKAA